MSVARDDAGNHVRATIESKIHRIAERLTTLL
jgi:hypothetical protein